MITMIECEHSQCIYVRILTSYHSKLGSGGVDAILADPGRLCAGLNATLTCEPPGDSPVSIEWLYNGSSLGAVSVGSPSIHTQVSDLEFLVSLSSIDPFVSRIILTPISITMDGTELHCVGRTSTSAHSGSVKLKVQNLISECIFRVSISGQGHACNQSYKLLLDLRCFPFLKVVGHVSNPKHTYR